MDDGEDRLSKASAAHHVEAADGDDRAWQEGWCSTMSHTHCREASRGAERPSPHNTWTHAGELAEAHLSHVRRVHLSCRVEP